MSKFKVLWIDDQPEKIILEKEVIETVINEYGFEPVIETVSTISTGYESRDAWFSRISSREYDLLLIDFNLCSNIFGDMVIGSIRSLNNIFVDIILYSSARDEMIQRVQASYNGGMTDYLDDVHIIVLDDSRFEKKVRSIIGKIVYSWFNMHSVRGIILSKASKFEGMINQIIKDRYEQSKENIDNKINSKRETVISHTTTVWDRVVKDKKPGWYLADNPSLYSWNSRFEVFKVLLDDSVITCCDSKLKEKIYQFFTIRNDFAHNRIEIKNGRLLLHKNQHKTDEYTEDKIRDVIDLCNSIEKELERIANERESG